LNDLDPYKRLFSILLYGIFFVSYVKLNSTIISNFSDVAFYLIVIPLTGILIFQIAKKFRALKFTRPNIFNLSFVLVVDLIIVKDIYKSKNINNIPLIIFLILMLFLCNVSLFFVLDD
jgi:hypothetical protein